MIGSRSATSPAVAGSARSAAARSAAARFRRSASASPRAASRETLLELLLLRLARFLELGTTTIEAKSGYGLSLEHELASLEVVAEAARRQAVECVPTFLGAHDVPPEYRGRKAEYVAHLCDEMLPRVAERRLAEYCDAFTEAHTFDLADTRAHLGIRRAGVDALHGLGPVHRVLAECREEAGRARVHTVQLTRQLLTFAQPHLVALAHPRAGPVADRRPDRGAEQEERDAGDEVAEIAGRGLREDLEADDEPHPDRSVVPGRPAEQRVREKQQERAAEEDRGRLVGEQAPGDVEQRRAAERDRRHGQRARAAPEERDGEPEADDEPATF